MHRMCHVRLIDHAQVSVQDRLLLQKLVENPGVYSRQAFIQKWLLFKEIRYYYCDCSTIQLFFILRKFNTTDFILAIPDIDCGPSSPSSYKWAGRHIIWYHLWEYS